MDDLKITKERVLKAAASCSMAKNVLKELFPEVFVTELCAGDLVKTPIIKKAMVLDKDDPDVQVLMKKLKNDGDIPVVGLEANHLGGLYVVKSEEITFLGKNE